MYYHRHIEAVSKRIAKRKPLIVLTGARQVGKSTMLKKTFDGSTYITMNNPLLAKCKR